MVSEPSAWKTVKFQAGPRLDFVGEMPVPRAPRSCDPSPATPLRRPCRSLWCLMGKLKRARVAHTYESEEAAQAIFSCLAVCFSSCAYFPPLQPSLITTRLLLVVFSAATTYE